MQRTRMKQTLERMKGYVDKAYLYFVNFVMVMAFRCILHFAHDFA